MPIFNSLGSNYSFLFSLFALKQVVWADRSASVRLQKKLEEKFGGRAFFFYKGRDAIEFALRAHGIGKDDQVLTQAFTCHAIEEAILRAGAQPVFVDLEKNEVNPSVRTLTEALEKAPHAKAVLLQHTLGYPADVQAIRQWCDAKKILLIEDLAQSYGALDAQGKEVGSLADAIIFSFGRDKVIDAVSGGGVILKQQAAQTWAQENLKNVKKNISFVIILRDMTYPFLTWIVRNTDQIFIGKFLFRLAKSTGWFTSPIESPTQEITMMPLQYAALALHHFKHVDKQLQHRRQIAEVYAAELHHLKSNMQFLVLNAEHSKNAVNLRYPYITDYPDLLAESLTRKHIYITDRWYREAVDSGSLHLGTQYVVGSCQNAEYLADHVLNLPTHRGISMRKAKRLAITLQQEESKLAGIL